MNFTYICETVERREIGDKRGDKKGDKRGDKRGDKGQDCAPMVSLVSL